MGCLFHAGSRARSVTILGPSIDWQQDEFGHMQDPVNYAVDFLWPCIAPDGKDSTVSGGQAHGHDWEVDSCQRKVSQEVWMHWSRKARSIRGSDQ
jgi:hypothetical protein